MRRAKLFVYGMVMATTFVSAQNYNDQSVEALKYKLAQQKERVDGLTRIVEGMARTINELRENRSGGRGSRYSDEELIRRLGKMVDNINENYVSKAELKRAIDTLKDEYSTEIEVDDRPKQGRPKKHEVLEERDVEEHNEVPRERIYTTKAEDVEVEEEKVVTPRVFDDEHDTKKPVVLDDEKLQAGGSHAFQYATAVRLYNKKQYNQAKTLFKKLEKAGFKEAPTNYYLGEVAYFTKRYDDAIYYFKKSAKLYPKASYMHTLLLHAAISLEKIGQKREAVKFYQKIVNEYSNNSSVSIARIRLEKLQ